MHLQRRRTAESRIPTSSSTADVTRLDEVVVSHVPNSPLTRTALPHNNASPSSASTSKLPLPPSIAHHRHRHSRSMNAVPTLHTMTAAEDEDVVVPACAGSRASKLMALPFMRRQMHFKKTKASPPVRLNVQIVVINTKILIALAFAGRWPAFHACRAIRLPRSSFLNQVAPTNQELSFVLLDHALPLPRPLRAATNHCANCNGAARFPDTAFASAATPITQRTLRVRVCVRDPFHSREEE